MPAALALPCLVLHTSITEGAERVAPLKSVNRIMQHCTTGYCTLYNGTFKQMRQATQHNRKTMVCK